MPGGKNVPPEMKKKFDDCVATVEAKGNVDNPYAVCYASVVEGQSAKQIMEKFHLSNAVMKVVAEFCVPGHAPESFSQSEQIAVEEFMAQDFKKPFKILPIGKFYRGDRVLDITSALAQDIYHHWKLGLPRYGLNINVEHGEEENQPGAIGRVQEISLRSDGLYAERVELSKVGEQLLNEDRYRAVSPELIWTLNNGAKYQDPKTGEWYDNVLAGVAVTTTPFFGQDVQVFSAKAKGTETMAEVTKSESDGDHPASHYLIVDDPEKPTTWHLRVKAKDGKPDRGLMGAAHAALYSPQGYRGNKYEGPNKEEAKAKLKKLYDAEGADFPEKEKGNTDKGENFDSPTMHQVHVETTGGVGMAKKELTAVQQKRLKEMMDDGKSEEEAIKTLEEEETKEKEAQDKEKGGDPKMAETFAQMKVQVETLTAANKSLLDQFTAERQLRRTVEFVEAAEKFSALPAKQDDLGKHLLWLYDADNTADKARYSYFDKLLTAANQVAADSQLFSAAGTGRSDEDRDGADPFLAAVEKKRAEKFGDQSYAEGFSKAYTLVGQEQPELARNYVMRNTHIDK